MRWSFEQIQRVWFLFAIFEVRGQLQRQHLIWLNGGGVAQVRKQCIVGTAGSDGDREADVLVHVCRHRVMTLPAARL